MLRQLLHRNAWARNAKGDPGQEASVVANFGSSQDGLDLPLVDTPFARLVVRLDEFDWGFRKAEVAVSTAFRRHSAIVGEMSGQFPAQAALGGDEVDYSPDSFHVALFSGLDLRVDGCDDLTLRLFPLWKVFENAEAVHHTAWLQFNSPGVVPFLQFLYRIRSWEASASSCSVDVDSCPLVGGLAHLFECLGDR